MQAAFPYAKTLKRCIITTCVCASLPVKVGACVGPRAGMFECLCDGGSVGAEVGICVAARVGMLAGPCVSASVRVCVCVGVCVSVHRQRLDSECWRPSRQHQQHANPLEIGLPIDFKKSLYPVL